MRVYAPWASALPTSCGPRRSTMPPMPSGTGTGLAVALTAIARLYMRTLGDVPWNAWLHTRPLDGPDRRCTGTSRPSRV